MQWFPTPPTDTLYKFAAISGTWLLAIVLVGMMLLEYVSFRNDEDARYLVNASNSTLVSEDIKKRMKAITEGRLEDNKLEWLPEGRAPDDEYEFIADALARHQASIAESDARQADKIGEKLRVAKAIKLDALMLIAAALGILAVGLGYTRWYQKVQKPADEKLKWEADLLRQQLDHARSTAVSKATHPKRPEHWKR